ncbi:MAG: UPF0280 family protein [Desulfobulbaceae bacterium]|nr:UPF0280 family protein [Desulfobulbaceae bacterium]
MTRKRKKPPESYRERRYRKIPDANGLQSCQVKVRETDLHILAPLDVEEQATHLIVQYRTQLENYLARCPVFVEALAPLKDDPTAVPLVRDMLRAGLAADVGPMAAVAGVIAEYVGRGLLKINGCTEVVVENGGDIFMQRRKDCTAAIFAGESPLSYRVGVRVPARDMPLGICTSSGTVGHSLSLGQADSVTVISPSTALADAAATRLGNEVSRGGDIGPALEIAAKIPGLAGVVIVVGEELGAWGQMELVAINNKYR